MNIRKKGAAIGFTATLLASMIAVIAAPFASAATTVTSAGAVPRGGTSAGTAAFTFGESAIACFAAFTPPDNYNNHALNPALTVTILDSASAATVHFVGTPVVTAPGSLGATASITGAASNVLTINFTNSDPLNIEQISVSGLNISADNGAANGAIKATLGGSQAACVVGSTPATGTVATGIGVGSLAVIMNNTSAPCLFVVSGTVTPGGTAGNLVFATGESIAITGVAAGPGAGQQTLTFGAPGTTAVHNAAEGATQANVCAGSTAIGSPGTVGSALTETVSGTVTVVNIGENNQATGSPSVSESPRAAPRTLTAGSTVTFTISTAGVLYSASPTAYPTSLLNLGAGAGAPVTCSISVDRKSCTVTVTGNTESTVPTTGTEGVQLGSGPGAALGPNTNPIRVDVDATATAGTPVNIVASSSAGPVVVSSSTVAFIGRVVVAVAAQPTIFIGFNDQQSGMKTLTESGAGFFQAGAGSNNTFGLCLTTTSGETFTRAPWAVVTTTAAGALKILNPATATGVSQLPGTLTNGGRCAYWTVFSASTVASTIEIRGSADGVSPLPSGANNGPRLSVPNTAVPGATTDALLIGQAATVIAGCTSNSNCASNAAFAGFLSQAIRAFKNSVTVTAASQPNCPPGTADCLLGNIVITETQNGQFKAGDTIRGWFVPSAQSNRNDVLIKASNTNDLPIITTNAASGLLVSPVTVICPPNIPLLNICFFQFTINQQSFGTLGQINISNIHASIASGAQLGPILMDWNNTGIVLGVPVGAPSGQPFEAVVSNGNIGAGPNPPALTSTRAASAIGKTQNPAAFSVATKVVHLVATSNNIVTIRIKVDPALIGKTVIIQRAVKNSAGVWSSFTNLTTRVVSADGYAYYYASAHSRQWVSYRGVFPGNAQYAASHSQTVQVRWI